MPTTKSRKLSEAKQPSTPRSLPPTPIDAPRIDYSVEELNDLDKTELIDKILEVQSFLSSILSKLDTVDALTSKVESMASDVERNHKDVELLKKPKQGKNESLGLAMVGERITKMEKDNYAQQQYSRRDSIEIVGIPEAIPDKDVESKAIDIMKAIGVTVARNEIQACHRLAKKDRIIVKFVNRKTAVACLQSRAKLKTLKGKSLGLPDKCKLYVNKSLCPQYRKLFWKCKNLFKEAKIQSCWTYNGTIKVKLLNDDVHPILHDDDIISLKL